MDRLDNLSYGTLFEQTLDIYLPENKDFDTMLYFHGGGLESGDKSDAQTFAEYLCENGIATVSANYRMYPNAVFPDFIQDAADAALWTYQNIRSYGGSGKFYIGGSSAGAYLSMMLCFHKEFLYARKIPMEAVMGYIHDAGQPTCHYRVLAERGLDPRRIIVDESAPLFHMKPDADYPPMLFVVSDDDIPNRYEQTMLAISTLKCMGYGEDRIKLRVIHGAHCQYVRAMDEDGKSTLGKIISEFIDML